jgi:hypothetical protein
MDDGDETLLACAQTYMTANPPTFDEVLGAVCQIYNVTPADIGYRRLERRVFCFLCRLYNIGDNHLIAAKINISHREVLSNSVRISIQRKQSAILADDLDLIAINIAQRVMFRKRRDKNGSHVGGVGLPSRLPPQGNRKPRRCNRRPRERASGDANLGNQGGGPA